MEKCFQTDLDSAQNQSVKIDDSIPEEVTKAREELKAYWETHKTLRDEMKALKKKREGEMGETLQAFKDGKAMHLIEERNFEKINKIFAYEKKRYGAHATFFGAHNAAKAAAKKGGSSPKAGAATPGGDSTEEKKIIPFGNSSESVQKMALALISYQNITTLQTLLKEMFCEGVESNKKKALIEHSVRMYLVNMEKKTFAAEASTKNKVAKMADVLAELEKAYDESNNKAGATAEGSEKAMEEELNKMVAKKKNKLWQSVRKELEAMEDENICNNSSPMVFLTHILLSTVGDMGDFDLSCRTKFVCKFAIY